MSNNGTIYGNYSIGNGVMTYGFIATPAAVPVPAAVWLFGSAIAGFINFNIRKSV